MATIRSRKALIIPFAKAIASQATLESWNRVGGEVLRMVVISIMELTWEE